MEYTHSIESTKVILVLSVVLACCITDMHTRRIPNAILLPALATALVLNSLNTGWAGLADSLGGAIAGIGMLMPLYLLGRMGAGDLKLLGFVGATLGTWGAIAAGLATMMAGGILGLAYLSWLLAKPAIDRSMRQFVGLLTGSADGGRLSSATEQSVRAAEIPYALAIAAGTVAALAYTGLFSEVVIK